ncbi:Asp-tRNA(Asn)/Glu-tRNA(Gln) amidotransferase subunit GatB [bacterium]|nr:Asp-tRNA(Asn)/Glu-tRNA(Gln) amidotransferase subunit GatB [bacterium]
MEYDVIICFETHVELNTNTKLFCDCPVELGAPANTNICPVCTGQPGALPVLNKKAVAYSVKAGLALNCRINQYSRFARKNYFYPDLPKGYQISQFELPFCEDGFLQIIGDDGKPYKVGIKRIHLEEDAGKLVHSADSVDEADYSMADYNRSSVPLLEIVGDHERNPIRSLTEARAYLEKIRQILRYTGVSDCIIEMGQFRCDVNISVRPKGSKELNNRTEIKNMSSFRFINEALQYEIQRHKKLLEAGEKIVQETRLYDDVKKVTRTMRSKENAPDYRYFPDPDLIEVDLDDSYVEKIRATLPELPDQQVKRLENEYGIPHQEALVLTKDKGVADYFFAAVPTADDSKTLLRWIVKELFKQLNETNTAIKQCPIAPPDFAELINFLTRGEINQKSGRIVLEAMFSDGGKPAGIIAAKGLKAIQDSGELEKVLTNILRKHPQIIEKIKAGETKLIDFLIGQVMQATRGKANPKKIHELIGKKVN